MVEGEDTNGVNVFLAPAAAPPPVVTRGWGGVALQLVISIPQKELVKLDRQSLSLTYPREGVTERVLPAWHPLLLLWEKIVLPHLE